MRPTSKSTESGATSTGRSTNTDRSSTCSSQRRDADAARRFFRRALSALKVTPGEVVTDAAAVYPTVLDELIPPAWHHVEQYAVDGPPATRVAAAFTELAQAI
jgi:hypothetical protein